MNNSGSRLLSAEETHIRSEGGLDQNRWIQRPNVIVGMILVLGGALRWFYSAQRGLTYDDTFSYFLSVRPLNEIVSGTAADTMPPLYYFLLHWMMLGKQVWVLRSLNIVFSLAAVFLIYRIASWMANPRAGLWAALFAALSPFQIYHAQDIRMYALLCFTQAGYIACFWKLFYGGSRAKARSGYWAGLIIFGTLAMYSHNLAVIPLVTANLILLLHKRWKDFFQLVAAQLGIVVLFIPWLVYIPGQIAKIQHAFWTPSPGLVEILQSIVYLHSNWPLVSIWVMGLTLLFSLQIIILVGIQLARMVKTNSVLWVPILFVIVPPAALFVLSYLMRPVYVTRVFIVSALIYDAVLGIIISISPARFVRIFVAAAALICAVGGLPDLYGYAEFPRSPFEQSSAYIQAALRPGDVIIHDNKLSYFPSQFYDPQTSQVFIGDEPGSPNDTLAVASQDAMGIHPAAGISAAAGAGTRVWFVVFTKTIEEYKAMGVAEHPSLTWLKQHYHLTSQRNFNDLEIYSFTK